MASPGLWSLEPHPSHSRRSYSQARKSDRIPRSVRLLQEKVRPETHSGLTFQAASQTGNRHKPPSRLQPTAVLTPAKRRVLAILRCFASSGLLRSSGYAGLFASIAPVGSPSLRRRTENRHFQAPTENTIIRYDCHTIPMQDTLEVIYSSVYGQAATIS